METIEIVGGGLAGLSLGLALRRAGVPVTLFEAGDFPRHRVCGEFIAGLDARTSAVLQLAPFLADAARHRSVQWATADGGTLRNTLPSPAYGVSRYELDARLARAFVAAGGDLRTRTRVAASDARAGRVLATGRKRAGTRWLGLKVHALDLPLDADLEVHLGNHAYVGLSRVENGRVNVCGLFRRDDGHGGAPAIDRRGPAAERAAPLLAFLQANGLGRVAARLASVQLDQSSFTAVSALAFDRGVPRPDGLRIGDAYAMIPPFTGNGMAMAFQSAAAALNPLTQYANGKLSWPQACADTRRALARQFRTRLFTADALHPFLLRPGRQRGLMVLGRARMLPFRPLFAMLH